MAARKDNRQSEVRPHARAQGSDRTPGRQPASRPSSRTSPDRRQANGLQAFVCKFPKDFSDQDLRDLFREEKVDGVYFDFFSPPHKSVSLLTLAGYRGLCRSKKTCRRRQSTNRFCDVSIRRKFYTGTSTVRTGSQALSIIPLSSKFAERWSTSEALRDNEA